MINLKRDNKLLEKKESFPKYIEQSILRNSDKQLYDTYGLIADPELDIWKNISIRLRNITTTEYFNKLTRSSYHNLCTYLTPPPGLGALLGLGLTLCIKYKTPPKEPLMNEMERMKRDIRLKYLFAGETNINDFNKKLYIKSDWDPTQANADIENRLEQLEEELTAIHKDIISNTQLSSNLNPAQRILL